MKQKIDYIDYWIKMAEEDLDTAEYLIQGKKYVHALFLCHLSIEKLCKALWIKNNVENVPPKIHNLIKLLDLANNNDTNDFIDILRTLNAYQIEGRYQNEIADLNKILNLTIATNLFNETKLLRLWLLKKLQ